MNDVLFPWHPHKKILIFSFIFALCFHAAFFIFIHRFPAFVRVKHSLPPKLTVHLCAKVSARHVSCDVRNFKPSRFMPRVPPPPKKTVPKKKEITNPKVVHKPKIVKRQPPKKALKHVAKKIPPITKPKPEPKPEIQPEPAIPGKIDDTVTDVKIKSTAPVAGILPAAASQIRQEKDSRQVQPSASKRELAYPDYGKSPALTYPSLARRRGIEGRVVLKVLVSKEGHPLKVVLEHSSGSSILDRAAMKAVKGWIFKPGKLNGVTVDMWVRVPVIYRLE